MVGVAEHDVGTGLTHLAPVHALHRAGGTDRHEGGRAHHAVRRGQAPGARGAIGGEQFEMIGQTGVRTIHDGAYCLSEQADQPARATHRTAYASDWDTTDTDICAYGSC